MTNNELIEIICKEIDETFGKRIDSNRNQENECHITRDYDEANRFQVSRLEDESMRIYIKNRLHILVKSLDLNTDDSPYKKMWETLKRYIDERYVTLIKNIKSFAENECYTSAVFAQARLSENEHIKEDVQHIEEESCK